MINARSLIAAVAASLVLVAGFGRANADEQTQVTLTTYKPEPTEKDPKPVPSFRSKVKSAPGLQAKDFILKAPNEKPPKQVVAGKVVSYKESDEPMAMVILVQGNLRWMGNQKNPPEDGAVYEGAFDNVVGAIDELAKAGPTGSQAGVIVYAESGAIEKAPMGDASQISGSMLGTQENYSEYITKPFVAGLKAAYSKLAAISGHRRILVVIGDGTDSAEDITEPLRDQIKQFKDASIEVYTIFFSNMPDDGPAGQQNMKKLGISGFNPATSKDNIPTFAGGIATAINSWYYVDFPGDTMPNDGQVHTFVVGVKGEDSEPFDIQTEIGPPKPEKGGSLWWLWIVIPLVLIAGIAVLILKGKKEEPVVEEAPVAAPPPPPPVSSKTVMLGGGGGDDSMPVVGWIVPITGANAYQTFKLLPGKTVVGTGGQAHVIVQDHFMSTEHAQIVCAAGTFVLQDGGSTNGMYVNSRKVSTHELVDNDVFTLGKTDFKFKSIN